MPVPMLPNGANVELGPNGFEEHWRRPVRPDEGPLADPSGGDAAAASAAPGEDGQELPTFDDSWLTEDERAQLDPNDPTYQLLMRAMARKSTTASPSDGQGDLQAQLEAFRLQQELERQGQDQSPGGEPSLWDGFQLTAPLPAELADYQPVFVSMMQDVANHVIGVLQQRAQHEEQTTRTQALRGRLQGEVGELLRGPLASSFRQDMGAVMRAANTDVGRAMLSDPSVGVRGIWNLIRAQQGKGPVTAQQAQTPNPRQQPQRQVFPGDKRNHAVERTVPSVTRSTPAATQRPEPRSTREAVEQAFADAVEAQTSRRL